jgi:hypothetical protein
VQRKKSQITCLRHCANAFCVSHDGFHGLGSHLPDEGCCEVVVIAVQLVVLLVLPYAPWPLPQMHVLMSHSFSS